MLRILLICTYYLILIAGWLLRAFLYAFSVACAATFVVGSILTLFMGYSGDWTLLPSTLIAAIAAGVLWFLQNGIEILWNRIQPYTIPLGEWVSEL